MRRLALIIITLLFVSFLLAIRMSAEVPHLIRFQGKVTDKAGAPLNGAYNITFRIYNSETGGAILWSETQSAIPVNNGIFTVLLGNVSPLDLTFDEPYWLSMEVSDDGEMSPRQRITSAGYAIHAETAEKFIEGSVVPQGAIILWRGSSCPSGYSRVTELDGRFLASGPTYNPAAGGSNTHTHGAGTYKGPSHTHGGGSYTVTQDCGTGRSLGGGCYGFSGNSRPVTGTSAADGTGAITGVSGTADNRPEFATILLCEKD